MLGSDFYKSRVIDAQWSITSEKSGCYPAIFPTYMYVSIDNTSKLNSANIDYIATHSEG